MKSVFAALLHNLRITERLGAGDKVSESLRITNDPSVIGNIIQPLHRQLMGELEVASLLTGAPVIVAESNVPDNMTPEQYLVAKLYEIQMFLMTTWVVLDNAINCEMGFLLFTKGGKATVTSNFLAHQYSTASGMKPTISISRERLREMRTLHRESVRPPDHPFQLPTSQLTSTQPRITRAIYLVNAARGQPDIAMKVAQYCAAFETLFATSQTELAHQLSERISCYLYKDAMARLSNYRRLKTAYALRSKVVHGATIREDKVEDAVRTSEYCDQIARDLFRRIFTEASAQNLFETGSESFDEEMLKLIFGAST